MRRFLITLTMVFLLLAIMVPTYAMAKKSDGSRIQDGTIVYRPNHHWAGQPIEVGYDEYGTNYQSHTFNGLYINVNLNRWGLPPYRGEGEAYIDANPELFNRVNYNYFMNDIWPNRDVHLTIKWNDAWLSNRDGDGDGLLDGWYLGPDRIGTGAWQTTHMWGTYVGDDSKEHKWTYFEKLVAVPSDAVKVGGVWHTADGAEMGPSVMGSFALVQKVYNDPYDGYHGVSYLSSAAPGLGAYKD
ncbi:hypothetical protein ACFLVR_04530 [Chloroflexota bacterium]